MTTAIEAVEQYLGKCKHPKTYPEIKDRAGVNENTLRKVLGGLTWRKRKGAYKATGQPLWRKKDNGYWAYWTE